ncbi:hypothetical protein [Polyangium aurulentum]|uniref:hypothetical protein n=1 Tax=Polyangium aurulentum TaxID=2567896 RepID=UPI0010AE7890|nr:hypothetical protein [Polyangium aurulentum]UQA55048.1 hypothetical protein E8A73_027245 [Polyangium aurulentum]
MPAPIAPLLAFALGIVLAWLCRPDADPEAPLWDRPTIAVALYALLVYAPAAAYFLLFAGDWSFAYLVDSRDVPSAVSLVLVLLDAAALVFGFNLGRRALRRRPLAALGWLALAPAALAAAFVLVLHRRLGVDATFDQVESDFGLRPLPGSPLGYAILWMDAVVVAGAVFTARALGALGPGRRAPNPGGGFLGPVEPPSLATGGGSEGPVEAAPEDEPPRRLGQGRRR